MNSPLNKNKNTWKNRDPANITVCVLYGSGNGEEDVSVASANNAFVYIKELGYKAIMLAYNRYTFIKDIRAIKCDVVFNATHGSYGEDGNVQIILDHLRIPYTHSTAGVSNLFMHKDYSKHIFNSKKIKIPDWFKVKKVDLLDKTYAEKFKDHPLINPHRHIVKPCNGGSSVGVVLNDVDAAATLESSLNKIHGENFLVEEFIEGIEITVMIFNDEFFGAAQLMKKDPYIINDINTKPLADIIELKFPKTEEGNEKPEKEGKTTGNPNEVNNSSSDEKKLKDDNEDEPFILNYRRKYVDNADVNMKVWSKNQLAEMSAAQKKAVAYAHDLYREFDCNTISRTDFMIKKGEEELEPYILEVNTQPGLCDTSFITYFAKANQVDTKQLYETIIKKATYND